MRALIVIAAASLAATPVAAQEAPVQGSPEVQIPKELTDPAVADKLVNMMQALSTAFLDLPVGEVEAAVEGRTPTAEDRKRTIRDVGQGDDPHFEQRLQQQIATAKPMMQASMKALAAALPAMIEGLSAAAKELEKATANLPSPNYPQQ